MQANPGEQGGHAMEAVMSRHHGRRRRRAFSFRTKAVSLLVPHRMVLKAAAGASGRQAAREMTFVPLPACRIKTRCRAEGEVSPVDHRCDNGSPKIGEDVRGRIRQIIEKAALQDRAKLYVGTGVNV
jgi:hypothetical protein